MKKLESSLKNMLLVLTGITVIAVGLLAVVNEMTKGPVAIAKAQALSEAIELVVPGFDNNPIEEADTLFSEAGKLEFIIYPASKGGETIGHAVQATSNGFGGPLTILVGFDKDGNINDYSLLEHAETPGLGAKADAWFKGGAKGDITGQNPGAAALTVSKDGGKIDAITASTITSRAFLNAVNSAYGALSQKYTDAKSGATPQK